MKRKKIRKAYDQALLDATFSIEYDWKKYGQLMEHSIEPIGETTFKYKLEEAKYMFLIKEAKLRKISLLRY